MLARIGALLAVVTVPVLLFACGGDDNAAAVTPAGVDGGADGACPPPPATTTPDAAPNPVPTGAISFPSFDVWTPDAKGRVVGTATPPASRTIVQVLVNGTPALTKDGYAHWSVDADIPPGANPLKLTVIDSTGATTTTTGVNVASTVPMKNGLPTDAMLVKDGVVYAGDGNEIISIPAGGGPRTTLARLDDTTDSFHLFALDGTTLYFVTQKARFGSVPLAGGTPTLIASVFSNQRAAAVVGANLVLLSRFTSVGGGPSGLTAIPFTGGPGGPPMFLPLSYPSALNFEVLDYELLDGSFYVTLANHKPLIIPAAGGTVTDLDISRTGAGGDEFPVHIKASGGKLYVSFDYEGKTWFTTSLTVGALTPASLVLPADAVTNTRYVIDGDACFIPAFFGGIERVPLAGGAAKYLSDNDIVDHAFFGTADAKDIFLTTPKGVLAYSRATLQKRELYTWPAFDGNYTYRSVAATSGDTLYVAQGKSVTAITKSTGAGKVLVPTLQAADVVAQAIVADDKTLYVRHLGGIELYDASTGVFSKLMSFFPPTAKFGSAIAADATTIYTTSNSGDLVNMRKVTVGDTFLAEPFGTPPVVPMSMFLNGDTLWVADVARQVFRMPLATGAGTKVLDGASAGFSTTQFILAYDDATKLLVSINGTRSRVMVTNVEAGASYYLH